MTYKEQILKHQTIRQKKQNLTALAYAASKSYVLSFSEALSKEVESQNVVVSCLSPGPTDTNFFSLSGLGDKTTGFFSKKNRMSAHEVAMIGVNALFSRKLSVISGLRNQILANSSRFAPRSIVVKISKFIASSG